MISYQLQRNLRETGRKLKEARVAECHAMIDIRRLVIQALDAGMSVTAVAEAAGISRQTVYNILNEE